MGNTAGLSRPNRALLALVLLTVSPAAATECPPFRELVPDQVPRTFIQQRHLPSLPNPLLSSGLVQASDDRFVWQVCEPFDIRTVIDADGITQSVEGEAATRMGPEILQETISQISIADIFRGRFDQLGTVFEINPAQRPASDGNWVVGLVPRDEPIASLISGIDVTGCREVDQVSIRYRQGGRDDIRIGAGLATGVAVKCPGE